MGMTLLECVMIGDEDRFYVLTPIDIILAQKLDANDHVDWLLKNKHFEEAMEYVDNPDNLRLLKIGKAQVSVVIKCITILLFLFILKEAGLTYIYHLMKTKNFGDAARSVTWGWGRVSK